LLRRASSKRGRWGAKHASRGRQSLGRGTAGPAPLPPRPDRDRDARLSSHAADWTAAGLVREDDQPEGRRLRGRQLLEVHRPGKATVEWARPHGSETRLGTCAVANLDACSANDVAAGIPDPYARREGRSSRGQRRWRETNLLDR